MKFLKVFNKKSAGVAPIQQSFDNVSRDMGEITGFAQESRSLMQQWNEYFTHCIAQIHSSIRNQESLVDETNQKVRVHADSIQKHNSHLSAHSEHLRAHKEDIAAAHTKIKEITQYHAQSHSNSQELTNNVGELQRICSQLAQVNEHQAAIITSLEKDVTSLESNLGTMGNRYAQALEDVGKHVLALEKKHDKLEQQSEEVLEVERKRAESIAAQAAMAASTPASAPVAVQPIEIPALERPSKSESLTEGFTLKRIAADLTTAEKSMLYLLANTDDKLSYRDLAINYGRSPSTVKNVICRLKSKQIPLREQMGADGTKRYYLEASFRQILLAGKL